MAYSYTKVNGDGDTTIFTTPDYLEKSHISLTVDGVDTDFDWVTTSTIEVDTAPDSGTVVLVSRDTPLERTVDFQNENILTEGVLDYDSNQLVYIMQETTEWAETAIVEDDNGDLDAVDRKIVNVSTPTDDSDAANKAYVDTITDTVATSASEAAASATSAATSETNASDYKDLALGYSEAASTSASSAASSAASFANYGRGINVLNYGATGDGSTDDTTAIQSAIDDLSDTGGVIWFPAGTYVVSSTLTIITDHITLAGEGPQATIIKCSFESGNILEIGSTTTNVYQGRVTGITFTSSVSKTDGAGVKVTNAHQIYLDHVQFYENMYYCVQFEGGSYGDGQFLYYLENFEMNSGTTGVLIGYDGNLVQDVWISKGIIAGATESGILVKHGSGIYCDNLDILTCKSGFVTYPASGYNAQAIFCTAVICDTCDDYGFYIGNDGGTVAEINLVNCWGATCEYSGITINDGEGTTSGVNLTAFRAINNGQNGISILGGAKISISNPQVLSNGTSSTGFYAGIYVDTDVSDWSVIGGVSGNGGLFSGVTQGYGLYINTGASEGYVVSGLNVTDNATTGIVNNGTGVGQITACPGYNIYSCGDIYFHATGTTTTTVSSTDTYTPVVLDSIQYQSIDGAYDSTTGYFTAPVDGVYHFDAFFRLTGMTDTTDFIACLIIADGVYYSNAATPVSGSSTTDRYTKTVNLDVKMSAGSTMYMQVYQSGDSGLAVNGSASKISGHLIKQLT